MFWGCPVYVLDPKLQQGQRLPCWELRARPGIFLGLSRYHNSEVPLVLNLKTGSITTQFHVVFDDLFMTVRSISEREDPPKHWDDLCLNRSWHLQVDDEPAFLMIGSVQRTLSANDGLQPMRTLFTFILSPCQCQRERGKHS